MLRRLSTIAMTAVLALSTLTHAATAQGAESVAVDKPRALAYGALGANFNENLDSLDYPELREARARWIRGFFPMPQTQQGDPAKHEAISTITKAAGKGYDTILSLKFPYDRASFPAPGSAGMAAELARLDRVLPAVLNKVKIIAIGNEPFIESLPAERDARLNTFYETVARHVIDYRRAHCGANCRTVLYMGALNRLDLPDRRTPAAERWMTFVRETPEIEGVDIHPHIPSPQAAQPFLDFILPRMRPDQTFLVTEFSLVWYWKEHLQDPVPATFAQKYGFPSGTLVWQVIKAAIDAPFSERKWDDFLKSSPWFTGQAGFLRDQMKLYRGTGRLAVATYGFKQEDAMVANFGPDKTPWLLNSVYAAKTVRPRADLSGRGYWLEDFRALQQP
ncbi:hypothetical protein [Nonomuraea guangzhouensis]|uniref:Asl1-like glycosyl hydrolase catalytic domain-containing protein n=1 Tax=Nonomuraea guangzhouensis TaxID=1291555 RepID=A0ABW4FYR7_9ACTN|nr:hypothetical protein [Nonomuraea guangzhouensis]